MGIISEIPICSTSLLASCDMRPGSYADCFETAVALDQAPDAAFARFVYLFFDSPLFRPERRLLAFAGKAPAQHTDPIALAKGLTDRFAAWVIEDRRSTELLLTVPGTPIRTWLALSANQAEVRLRFGSAIQAQDGKRRLHWAFRATLGAHRAYSRALLRSAVSDWHRGKHLPV